MLTTQLNLETLRTWAAASPRPGSEHLADRPPRRHHPPPGPAARSRGLAAASLARAARRLDGDAARRAIA